MSNHHGHHRSSHHSRSRMHHSSHYQSMSNRSRNSSSNNHNNGPSSHRASQMHPSNDREPANAWTEHRSSSGKVYYYNQKTGVSQWEPPAEFRQQQQQHHQQQQRLASPESELSESSSIRQQQDKSPSSSASSHNSAQSEPDSDDKPLLTPSLTQYYNPELIADFSSSQIEELERQANQHAREASSLNERILKETVDLKVAKSLVHYWDSSLECQERKYNILKETIKSYGFV